MKLADIQRLQAAGLITEEQQQRIIGHFGLKEESSRFLAILLLLGAVLATAGIILLVAANWEDIPRLGKVAGGVALMLGAYAGGWHLRERQADSPRAGEALYLVGAGMFLANIALVGQIYHLSSRLPNALLLWWAGIAALPWILRSKALHVVALLAFGAWFGGEVFADAGWLKVLGGSSPLLLFGLLGLIYFGFGAFLRSTAYEAFAEPTEQLGLLGFFGVLYLLTIGPVTHEIEAPRSAGGLLFGLLAALGLGLTLFAGLRDQRLPGQWRWTWFVSLLAAVGLMAGALSTGATREAYYAGRGDFLEGTPVSYLAILVLFVLCLIQVQVGVMVGNAWMVNLGVAFIALDVLTTYLTLIRSMAQTGLMFLISGVFLIVFGFYLEKKRRLLLKRMKEVAA